MGAASPDILIRRGIEPGLIGTIVVSALIHAVLVAIIATAPGRFLKPANKLESYTVDLIAPNAIGGTNLVRGGGKAKEPPAQLPIAAKAEANPPAAPAPPAPVAAPAPAVAPAKPAEAPRAAEVPKPEIPKPVEVPKAAEVPKPVAPVKPAPAAAKPAEPKPVAAAKPAEVKPIAPAKPAPPPEAKPAEAKAVAKPAEAKPAAKAAEASKPAPPAEKADAAKPASAETAKKPADSAKAEAPSEAKSRDDAIAAAVQKRAAQAGNAVGDGVDQRIAAAVQRRAQQVQQGSGSGTGVGGPISVGPGSGAGGTAADLQYILYQGRMEERIKAAWAWAGSDKSLQAVVQFNLSADGDIKNVRTIQSSGDRQYDASCERAVRAVNPLEAVPDKYRDQFATVEMTFKPTDLER